MTSCVCIVGLGDRSERSERKRWAREEKNRARGRTEKENGRECERLTSENV